jgi:hypothetical protein
MHIATGPRRYLNSDAQFTLVTLEKSQVPDDERVPLVAICLSQNSYSETTGSEWLPILDYCTTTARVTIERFSSGRGGLLTSTTFNTS